jgi:hypothetical protein
MMQDDFYGLNQQVRWIGFVEDNKDPSQLGRCKVRILGWYSDDKNLAPTDCLPWAQAQFAPGIKSFAVPKVGEWVTGYFLDGKMAQHPVYDGVLPGVNYNLMSTIPGAPRPPSGIALEQADTPSVSRLGRGEMTNSLIDRSNQNLAHVCDETLGIRIRAGFERLKNTEIVQAIRGAIKKLIGLLNTTDTSGFVTWAINELKKIAAAIKYIVDIITEILDFVRLVKLIVRTIRAIIQYILGLPAKFFRFLRQCIAVVLAAVVEGVSSLFSGLTADTLPGDLGIDDLFKEAQQVLNQGKELVEATVELVNAPAEIIGELIAPLTPSDSTNSLNSLLALSGSTTTVEGLENDLVNGVTTFLSENSSTPEQAVEQSAFNTGLAPGGA